MAHKIKQLNQSCHEIAALRNSLHVVYKLDGPSHDLRRDRETISFVLASEDDPAKEDIPVLPIVGIGGLGKTALAKLVFNDAAVDTHFELKRWVCVSVDFDLKGLMVKIIKFGNGGDGDPGSRDLERLQESLQECLNEITGTIPCHYLKALPHVKSLSLFLKFAFKKGKEKQHPNLAKIGQTIVKKCQGIPLVVKALGSSLFFKTSEQEWTLVRDSEGGN
ncbi:hypothetical protein GOBAR_AA26718 [Gossypium barbadense]|uniref:NB-ARC domain-containing protein n=1 Tax=Gossypium barbadense TaxID=3634 RepID=A0A2P5WS88_GOSBA|nr:hypothetical protein GOBAR_AA26718 [Gossypium barbadense]